MFWPSPEDMLRASASRSGVEVTKDASIEQVAYLHLNALLSTLPGDRSVEKSLTEIAENEAAPDTSIDKK